MKKRITRVEELGLDLNDISLDDLEKIAEITESEIRKALDEALGPRILKYLLMVQVDINSALNVIVDLAVDSHIPPFISLESVLDRAIKRGLDRARQLIKAMARKSRKEENSYSNS